MTSTMVAGRGDITTMRSASSTASSMAWVTSRVVVARSIQIRCSSSFIRWRVIASRAPNGSSSSSTLGSVTNARAMADPLAHAAGQLGRASLLEPAQADQLDQLVDEVILPGSGAPGGLQGEADVGPHRAPRQQRRVLEGDPEVVLAPGDRRRLAVHPHRPGGRRVEVGEDAQHGRLAAAGRPDERGQAAGRGDQVDVVDGDELASAQREHLAQPADLEALDHVGADVAGRVDAHAFDRPVSWSGNTSA